MAPKDQALYSYAVQAKEVVEIPFPVAVNFTWDSYWRAAYNRANSALQRQANLLVRRGNVTFAEARNLVEVQRNGLVAQFRKPLTPFGRLYSEILKPSNNLPTLEKLLQRKGSVEAVLRSVGGNRQAVNRVAFAGRVAGPAMIALEITMTVTVIQLAPEDQKNRVAAREIGGATGSIAFGLGGAWAGCAALATLASPSLVIPVVGEISTGGACLVGGLIGGAGLGFVGRKAGEAAGEAVYWQLVDWQWIGG